MDIVAANNGTASAESLDGTGLHLRLTISAGQNSLSLPSYFGAQDTWRLADAQGNKVRYVGPKVKRALGTPIVVEPGESRVFEVSIASEYHAFNDETPRPFKFSTGGFTFVATPASKVSGEGETKSSQDLVGSLGFGTMEYADGGGISDPAILYAATKLALAAGVKSFDCAEMYQTTKHVGKALKESSVPREQLHITTKLKGMPVGSYASVKKRMVRHLADLELEFVDLLLVHWPGPGDCDLASNEAVTSSCTWEWFDANIEEAWANMVQLQKDGLTKKIGVSNFYTAHLKRLVAFCSSTNSTPPAANEIFLDITHQERELLMYMATNNIQPIGYRALAFLPVVAMAAQMGDPTNGILESICAGSLADVNIHQLVLSWFMKQGVHVLFKSRDAGHISAAVAAAANARSSGWLEGDEDKLAALDGSEMVAMCGGVDETAALFRGMGPATS